VVVGKSHTDERETTMAADLVRAVRRYDLGTQGHPGDRMVTISLTEWGIEIAGLTRDRRQPPPAEESSDTVCRTAR
jgi:hypothetical protein